MVLGKVELGGGLVGGGMNWVESGEGFDGVEVVAAAEGAGRVAAEGGNAGEGTPGVLAGGATGTEGDRPIKQKGVLAKGFAEGLVHREPGEGEGWVETVPRAVDAARDGVGSPTRGGKGERDLPGLCFGGRLG